jgi:nucleotide-binding universal stress UspA family protein
VAIDPDSQPASLADALRAQVRLALSASPNCRVACVNVLKQAVLSNDTSNDADGTNRHIARLVSLQHWARPLGLPEGAVTFHVIEAVNAAEALLDYARTNHVDHIIMGARAESLRRNMLGSVSAQVAAHAPCTVSVVRQRAWPDGVDEVESVTAA